MIAQTDVRTFYELQPIVPVSQWWQLAALAFCIVILLAFIIWMYVRDSRELPRVLTFLMSSLRIIAFLCILVYVLNPGKRSETRIVKSSRLAVLIDTSLSMGLRDKVSNQGPSVNEPRRIDRVIDWLNRSSEIDKLRADHDITVYRFGDLAQPESIVTLAKTGTSEISQQPLSEQSAAKLTRSLRFSSIVGCVGLAIVVSAIMFLIACVWGVVSGSGTLQSRSLTLSITVSLILVSVGMLGWADLVTPQYDLLTSIGIKAPSDIASANNLSVKPKSKSESAIKVDWADALAPSGTSTQLGSAIQHIVNKERGGPIAGIAVVTDGRNNAGAQPARAIAAAANAGIPVFPIGIGSIEMPKNVLVADIQAPPKVFPADKFQVKGIVKSFGLVGKTVRVRLLSVDEKEQEVETIEEEVMIRLMDDGQATPVEFSVSHQDQGKRRYIIRADSVKGDFDPRDNERAAVVEIVERQTKVLLIAGGPNREFRFLRNQLYRDKDILLHVWLQSSTSGADQESDVLLQEFPKTREELFFFDCVIAFDPDWRELSKVQSELLERWVAEQAGGLVVVAGPVNTPEWTRRPRGDEAIDKIRRLYPVSFYSQGSAQLKLGRFGGDTAYPLDFSREGRAAEFLWLGDSATDSQANWGRFEGVFGYYSVNEPKPGADVLANFADPATMIDDTLPIYLASQFYGAGRVFFQASGEMWRIRRLEVEHFQEYYNKLIRWSSQGRLLRDSTRGVLLTDRERCWMGDQVVVQAILRDAQDQPLMAPNVLATLMRPDGTSQDMDLKATENAVRPGTFHGSFTAGNEGEYRVSLPIPNSPDFEVLSTGVEASIPDLEKERPQRNDSLLSELADKTHGHFFIGMKSFQSSDNNPLSPTKLIPPQDQETFLAGTLDRFLQRKLMMWLLAMFVTALACEWTVRRLHKLA